MERDRIHGESNLHPVRDGLRVLRTIMRERFSRLHAPGPAWAALTGPAPVRGGGRDRRE